MKRIVLVGITLLLVALFAGCGGVSQEDYDAAVAERDAVQSNLATALAEIAELEALEAEIEAAAEEATKPATYTNSDYGFSLEYPREWVEKTDDPAMGVIWRSGEGTYRIPAVRLIVLDEATGATLEEAFTAVLESDNKVLNSFTASSVNINGTDFTQAEVDYTGGSGGYDSLIIGLVKNGKWIIIESYTISLFPYSYEGLQEEIINSVTFE
jgi:hypothetical protein